MGSPIKGQVKKKNTSPDKKSLPFLLAEILLTYLIRLLEKSPSGIGYMIERAEVIAKDNEYELIDSFTEILKHVPVFTKVYQ